MIGLNEVDKHFSHRSDNIDQLQYIAKELNYYHVFSPSISKITKKTIHEKEYGNGLLSRFPIVQTNNHLFDMKASFIETRSILEATVKCNSELINVYVTHLSLLPFLHKKQSEFFKEQVKKPVIILGDWNMKPNTKKWKMVVNDFIDVWAEKGEGLGFTFPSTKPRMRLDYIFVSKIIRIVNVEVFDSIPVASDHLPVISTLSL